MYRLRKSDNYGESAWSVIIKVRTTKKPKTSEDFVKAVNHKDLERVHAILQGGQIKKLKFYYTKSIMMTDSCS